jgi:hypothetical protein
MPSSTLRPASRDVRRTAALCVGLLAGPVVWFALLEANYVMSYVACETGHTWFMHAATLASIVAVAAAGWGAWRSGPAEDSEYPTPPTSPDTGESRARWMSIGGVALSLWFILVILAMEVPIILLATCRAK